jgi:FkbH-like protein
MTDRLYVIADFNAETFARYFTHTASSGADVRVAPMGQVFQTLALGPPDAAWSAFIWTRPEGVIEGFRRAAEFERVDAEAVLSEVAEYARRIGQFAKTVRNVFVATWSIPSWIRGYGMLDFRRDLGLRHLLALMNLKLSDALAADSNLFVLDSSRWLAAAPGRAVSSRLWYASKTLFGPEVIEEAAEDVAAALSGLRGQARRLVILDLDNVLWGGIVGEVGWESIALGGHDFMGEAFVDFQRALKALTRRGIQLAIASKNDEHVALEVFDRHPEMQLCRSDLVAWRINWGDKARNVVDLLAEVGLGPESAVFIDDRAIERARVADAVPGIMVPEWPEDPARYRQALGALRAFDTPALTEEDLGRTSMYAAERARTADHTHTVDLESWLRSLSIVVTVEPLVPAHAERAAQLFNKTNQMNMTTRRLSHSELLAWSAETNHSLMTFRVADRFGDSGLTGIVGLAFEGPVMRMTDFLLSCRVLGRNVEEAMLHVAVAQGRARGASLLVADFVPTPRNAPCLELLTRSGLQTSADYRFTWDVARPYIYPDWVALENRAEPVRDPR